MAKPKDFQLRVIPYKVGCEVVSRYHYSRSAPSNVGVTFGAFAGQKFVGVVMYGCPAGPNIWKTVPGLAQRSELVELMRLWVKDTAPRFFESRLISRSLRLVKRSGRYRAAVSYADPYHGHIGVVYQATNWTFSGQGNPTNYFDLGDGQGLVHPMTVNDRLRTCKLADVRRTYPNATTVPVPGKMRYLYPFDRRLRKVFEKVARPYPKLPEVASKQEGE
jgi:hypothetical protein